MKPLGSEESGNHSLFENNHTPMLIVDPVDGALVQANLAAARFYGWPREQLERMHLTQINSLSPEENTAELERAQTMQRDHCNSRHRLADGSVRDVEVFSGPIRFDGRELLYSIVRDVTTSNRNNATLAMQARRAEALLELPALAYHLNETAFMQRGMEYAEDLTDSNIAFIHFVNDDAETIELVAWSRRTLEHYCKAGFDQHYPVVKAGIWANALRQRKPVVFNDYAHAPGRHGLPEGHAELARLISVPVIEQDRVVMLAGIGNKTTDYTDMDVETVQLVANDIWRIVQRQRARRAMQQALEAQRALNQKLEATQDQLLQSEKMASIGQIAAGVAHELNNPIGFISSNLGTLDSYLRDIFAITAAYEAAEATLGAQCPQLDAVNALKHSKDFDYLKTDIVQLIAESRDGLARVTKIVRDLKDFSRAGEATSQWTELHQGLDSTLNIVWNELKYKCTINKQYGELPPVWCVPSQLNQVFMNLLVNAAHAIPEKGEITLHTGRQNDEVFVAICDTGTGIAPENLTHIFEPFFTTKPVGKGTGLGLSLAYSIVQKHHGRIEVSSTPGESTCFTVWLPINPVDAETAAPIAPANPPAATP